MHPVRDICVIGAGAAGLLAATVAASKGASVILLEKNSRPGVKILASGGTHCNVTSTLAMPELGKAFGVRAERFLRGALHEFGPQDLRRLLAKEGVPTDEKPFEKVFPRSGRASDVLRALHQRLEASGASLRLDCAVTGISLEDDGVFKIKAVGETVLCKRVILTTGGQSFPKTGTTGDGYKWLESMGHTITPLRPALVPLRVDLDWVQSLTGIAVEGAEVRVVDRKGRTILARRRPILFTHRGLSGPGAMDASGDLLADLKARQLIIDWIPDVADDMLLRAMNPRRGDERSVLLRLSDLLPKRLIAGLMTHANVNSQRIPSQLQRGERDRLASALKRSCIPVAGHEGYAKAEVTAGGVLLDEVSPRTMESRVIAGLYLAGEILDVDGPIGGFNFQAAFSTGRLAGQSAAEL